MMDPRTPVIVGVGQVNGKNGAEEPIDLISIAAERAIADCGGGAAPPLDLVALSKIGTRQYANAPHRLAERLGCAGARTMQASQSSGMARTYQRFLREAARVQVARLRIFSSRSTFSLTRLPAPDAAMLLVPNALPLCGLDRPVSGATRSGRTNEG